jgi:hypothetical protein
VRRKTASRRHRFIARAAARFSSPLVAALLLPFLAAAWGAAWTVFRSVHIPWRAVWPVAAGAAAYGLLQAFWSKPMGLYVFGHELTHALAAWLSGYRVKSLRVSSKGGEVITTGTNLFVALAPYCIPLYTLIVVLVYAVARGPAVVTASPPLWCAFGVGFTFFFHAALTVHALRQHQPDLEHGGVFLSLVLILLANCLALVLLLKLLYPNAVSLLAFGRRWGDLAGALGRSALTVLSLVWAKFAGAAR